MALLYGCGIPAPPQPPSLNLARPVADLNAQRVGSRVQLEWTSPTENTDKTAVKGKSLDAICRQESPSAPCVQISQVEAGSGQTMRYADLLPQELLHDPPTPIFYEVEVRNRNGRSAGWSQPQQALAGAGAPAVTGLSTSNTAAGVKLEWSNFGGTQAPSPQITYRITRTLVNSPAKTAQPGPLGAKPPKVQLLEVSAGKGLLTHALDASREWDETYQYRVQAVEQAQIGPRVLEVLGDPSEPAEVRTKNVFPPAAPKGLAVVPVWGKDGKPAMDLNWEPNTEPTLAGYVVYRISKMPHRALESRIVISGDKPITATSFRDSDLQPGGVYEYQVIAVDTSGNQSPESNSVTETALTAPE